MSLKDAWMSRELNCSLPFMLDTKKKTCNTEQQSEVEINVNGFEFACVEKV